MAVVPIRIFPDPALSRPCEAVNEFGRELEGPLRDLWDTMYRSPGVGLAAPQIGLNVRLSVIDVRRNKKAIGSCRGPITLINPVLLSGHGQQIPREGCLSVPDLLGNVCRYESVTVRTQTIEGREIVLESTGFEALALQHEIDHLDGKLFLDRVSNLKTDLFRRKTR